MPKLSFVVPVYNVAPYLRECLDSLINQKGDVEILAVDDGSTDESPKILEEYRLRFPELILVYRKENGGLSDARNFGIERATGEYVAFVDSDDYIHPDFTRHVLESLKKNNADLLLFDYYYLFPDGRTQYASSLPYGKEDKKESYLTAAPMAWLRVYRRSLLGKDAFCKGLYYEDLDFTPRILPVAEKAVKISEALYYYRQREGSIMKESSFSQKWLDIFTVTERVFSFFQEQETNEYRNELEFLFTEHLLRSAALRFAPFPEGKDLLKIINATMKKNFPHWKKNPYLARTSLFFRLTVFFSSRGNLAALRILKKLKG